MPKYSQRRFDWFEDKVGHKLFNFVDFVTSANEKISKKKERKISDEKVG